MLTFSGFVSCSCFNMFMYFAFVVFTCFRAYPHSCCRLRGVFAFCCLFLCCLDGVLILSCCCLSFVVPCVVVLLALLLLSFLFDVLCCLLFVLFGIV